jgi:hypothetical protein
MENKRFNKGLVTLLAAGAIAVTSVLSGCNYNKKTPDIYQRIDTSNLPYETKQMLKEGYRNFDWKKHLASVDKLDKEQRKERALEFNKDVNANIFDPNNVSDKEMSFMNELGIATYPGSM